MAINIDCAGFAGTVPGSIEHREKIGEIGLDKLVSTYLCSKYGKDPTKCLDCLSLEGCPAGQRAVELLEEETSTSNHVPEKFRNKGAQKMIDEARKRAEKTSEAEDAVLYLMNTFGNTRHQALLTISRYKKKFPDLVFNYETHRGIKADNIKEHATKKPTEQDEVSLADFLDLHDDDFDGDHMKVYAENNDILSLTNPTVKRKLLNEFADSCESDSVGIVSNFATNLKAEYDRTQQRIVDISTKISKLSNEQDHLEKILESMGDLMELLEESRKNGNSYNEKDGV